MSAIGVEIKTCPTCRGAGSNGMDVTGVRVCMPCGGSGRVVTCMECCAQMSEPEAQEHGAYCATCRVGLDHPETKAA